MEGQEFGTTKKVSASQRKRDRKKKREELRNIPVKVDPVEGIPVKVDPVEGIPVKVDPVEAMQPWLEKYGPPLNLIKEFSGHPQETFERMPLNEYLKSGSVVDEIQFCGKSFYRLSKKGRILFKGVIRRCYLDIGMQKPKLYELADLEVQDDRLILGDGKDCEFEDVPANIQSMIKRMCGDKLPADVKCLLKLMGNLQDFGTNETLIRRHPCFMDEDEMKAVYCKLRIFQNSSKNVQNYLSQKIKFSTEYRGEDWIDYVRRYLCNDWIEDKIRKGFLGVLTAKGENGTESDHGSRMKTKSYSKEPAGLIQYIRDVFIHCLKYVGPIADDDKGKLFKDKLFPLIYMMFPEFLSNVAEDVFPMTQFHAYFD